MHGTIMVFMGVVPLAWRLRQTSRVPLADRRAGHGVPRTDHGQYWVFLPAAAGGPKNVSLLSCRASSAVGLGTSYPPLADIAPRQTMWLFRAGC